MRLRPTRSASAQQVLRGHHVQVPSLPSPEQAADDPINANQTVGVVVAAFNAERFLAQALGSVAFQTRLPDEVVVVDDGSSDQTADVAESFADRLPLTVIRCSANAGPGSARRRGVAELATELVVPLDADDLWLPNHLEVMTRAHVHQVDIVSPRAVAWLDGLGISLPADLVQPAPPRLGANQLARALVVNFIFSGSLFTRSLYDEVGGYSPSRSIVGNEDYDLWLRMLAAGATVLPLSHATVLYRRHMRNLSAEQEQAERECAVLADFAASHPGRYGDLAHRRIAAHRAGAKLEQAYAEARQSRRASARTQAQGALMHGNWHKRLRAASLLIAPELAVKLRDWAAARGEDDATIDKGA